MTHKKPIRCFEGETEPHERFWTWKEPRLFNAVDDPLEEPAELELYGYISEYSWFDDDITPKKFKEDLLTYGMGKPIVVRVNSWGGDLIAASVIKSMLDDYPAHITVKIDGIAASAATVVTMAGHEILINESAYFMIHDPLLYFMFAALNITDLKMLLKQLKAVKNGVVDSYETRTGLDRGKISNYMENETWFTGRETVELGFADELIESSETDPIEDPVLENGALVNAVKNFVNVPEDLKELLRFSSAGFLNQENNEDRFENDDPIKSAAVERLKAEVQILT